MNGKRSDFANGNGLKFERNNVQKTLILSTSTDYNTEQHRPTTDRPIRLKLKTVLKSTLPNPLSHAGFLGQSTYANAF